MAQARTALDHLLDARTALVDEAQRLAATIADLDALIGTMGGQDRLESAEEPPEAPAQTVKAAATVTPARTATRSARKAVSRRGPAKKAAARSAGPGEAPKSIRVHVLDMLAAENRDFGLAEIIDRVHGAGIQAHDDAVRSITIKLMKDGRVERVGRGQYRLARRGAGRADSSASAGAAEASAEQAPDGPPADTLDYSPPLNLNEPWGGNDQS